MTGPSPRQKSILANFGDAGERQALRQRCAAHPTMRGRDKLLMPLCWPRGDHRDCRNAARRARLGGKSQETGVRTC